MYIGVQEDYIMNNVDLRLLICFSVHSHLGNQIPSVWERLCEITVATFSWFLSLCQWRRHGFSSAF